MRAVALLLVELPPQAKAWSLLTMMTQKNRSTIRSRRNTCSSNLPIKRLANRSTLSVSLAFPMVVVLVAQPAKTIAITTLISSLNKCVTKLQIQTLWMILLLNRVRLILTSCRSLRSTAVSAQIHLGSMSSTSLKRKMNARTLILTHNAIVKA